MVGDRFAPAGARVSWSIECGRAQCHDRPLFHVTGPLPLEANATGFMTTDGAVLYSVAYLEDDAAAAQHVGTIGVNVTGKVRVHFDPSIHVPAPLVFRHNVTYAGDTGPCPLGNPAADCNSPPYPEHVTDAFRGTLSELAFNLTWTPQSPETQQLVLIVHCASLTSGTWLPCSHNERVAITGASPLRLDAHEPDFPEGSALAIEVHEPDTINDPNLGEVWVQTNQAFNLEGFAIEHQAPEQRAPSIA